MAVRTDPEQRDEDAGNWSRDDLRRLHAQEGDRTPRPGVPHPSLDLLFVDVRPEQDTRDGDRGSDSHEEERRAQEQALRSREVS